jgi:hypothetical protein
MVSVLGTMMVLSLLVALATVTAASSVRGARGGQDYQSALAAAEAGVADYLSRLNIDASYYLRANSTVTDASNPAMTTAGGVTLPGSTSGATFRYRVLSTAAEVSSTATVRIEAVGRSADVTRTVQATLGKKSFLDYMYFTEYETLDPLNTAGPDGQPAVRAPRVERAPGAPDLQPAGLEVQRRHEGPRSTATTRWS